MSICKTYLKIYVSNWILLHKGTLSILRSWIAVFSTNSSDIVRFIIDYQSLSLFLSKSSVILTMRSSNACMRENDFYMNIPNYFLPFGVALGTFVFVCKSSVLSTLDSSSITNGTSELVSLEHSESFSICASPGFFKIVLRDGDANVIDDADDGIENNLEEAFGFEISFSEIHINGRIAGTTLDIDEESTVGNCLAVDVDSIFDKHLDVNEVSSITFFVAWHCSWVPIK